MTTIKAFMCAMLFCASLLTSAQNIPANLNEFAYEYKYDGQNRLTHKKVPGSGWVYMVYDNRDRVVMTQDANQRTARKWSFTLYDQLNRPVMTGVYTHPTKIDQASMSGKISTTIFSEVYDGSTNYHGYTGNVLFADSDFSTGSFEVLTVTYYDNYLFKTITSEFNTGEVNYAPNEFENQYKFNSIESFPRVLGQVTGSKIKVLDSAKYLCTVNYYDDRDRVVQSLSTNYKGGADRITNVYDFTGKVTHTKTSHRVGASVHNVTRRFEYDHAGRLTKTWHKVNSRPEVILSALEYNELGQLITKKLHASADNSIDEEGTVYSPTTIDKSQYNNEVNIIAKERVRLLPGFSVPSGKKFKASTENQWTEQNQNPPSSAYAQVVDYSYNIRGWLTKINDVAAPGQDLFSMDLNYNTSTLGNSYDQFNGNISEAIWTSIGLDKQSYGYKYDAMNRLTHGNYFNLVDGNKSNRYNESIVDGSASGYDLNGNIKKLQRSGKKADGIFNVMDELTYTYAGNQVTRIDDAKPKMLTEEGFKENVKVSGEYVYDPNGNMTIDQNKGIGSISYNMLNLPQVVRKSGADSIVYVYDATGRKLRQQTYGSLSKATDYSGEFFYENDTLKFLNHEEGRTVMTSAIPTYEYFLKDHLGNTRVSFKAITETTEYKASLEPGTADYEFSTFRNYTAGVISSMNEFDHTDAGTLYTKSQLLTGGSNSQIGLSKSFEVMPGDVFDIEVFAKYQTNTGLETPENTLAAALATAFNLPTTGGTGLESFKARQAFNAAYSAGTYIGATEPYEDATAPKAYLNYILFDESFNVLVDFGFDQVDLSAGESSAPHDHLSLHVAVQKKGYLYVFISNENPVEQSVFFDDLKITRHSYVESISDYYPFGLTFNAYQRETGIDQNHLYNGKELQDEYELDWLDYGARMYMSDIGRWGVIDPLSEKMRRYSPYNYALNNPMRFIDPDGMFATDAIRAAMAEADEKKKAQEANAETDPEDPKSKNKTEKSGSNSAPGLKWHFASSFMTTEGVPNVEFDIKNFGGGKFMLNSKVKKEVTADSYYDPTVKTFDETEKTITEIGGFWKLGGSLQMTHEIDKEGKVLDENFQINLGGYALGLQINWDSEGLKDVRLGFDTGFGQGFLSGFNVNTQMGLMYVNRAKN